MRRASRRNAATALLVAVVASLVPQTAAAAGLSLEASAPISVAGDRVTFTGSLAAEPGCAEGRTVVLTRRPSAADPWETVAEASTDASGGYTLSLFPEESYRYVATVAARADPACDPADSPEVEVTVRARVTLALGRNPARASRCTALFVEVTPAKAGTEVVLQRRRRNAWRAVARPSLDDASRARSTLCLGWADLGTVVLRARWPAQDDRNLAGTSPVTDLRVVKARWMRAIDRLTRGRDVGVSVREDGRFLYRRRDTTRRTPASNEKLLLSMAVLDALGPEARMPTRALSAAPTGGVVRGDLWIVGQGDPSVGPAAMRRLARKIAASGIRRITGRVMGSRAYFARDWWADGWRSYFPGRYVALPTALTYRGNTMRNPEAAAARELARRLRAEGVRVRRKTGPGRHPRGLAEVARTGSRPLSGLLAVTNHGSSNFYAEVLGKRLGVARAGTPGTIAKGAAAIAAFVKKHGGGARANDASGLSYANRVSPTVIARLLGIAESESWGAALMSSLPPSGRGTLSRRLDGIPVRAKTGTLTRVSALSGWVLARRTGTWVEFSILSEGLPTSRAKEIEDRIARTLYRQAA